MYTVTSTVPLLVIIENLQRFTRMLPGEDYKDNSLRILRVHASFELNPRSVFFETLGLHILPDLIWYHIGDEVTGHV